MKRSVSGRLFLAVSAMFILALLFTAQKPEIKREFSFLYRNKPFHISANINDIIFGHCCNWQSVRNLSLPHKSRKLCENSKLQNK